MLIAPINHLLPPPTQLVLDKDKNQALNAAAPTLVITTHPTPNPLILRVPFAALTNTANGTFMMQGYSLCMAESLRGLEKSLLSWLAQTDQPWKNSRRSFTLYPRGDNPLANTAALYWKSEPVTTGLELERLLVKKKTTKQAPIKYLHVGDIEASDLQQLLLNERVQKVDEELVGIDLAIFHNFMDQYPSIEGASSLVCMANPIGNQTPLLRFFSLQKVAENKEASLMAEFWKSVASDAPQSLISTNKLEHWTDIQKLVDVACTLAVNGLALTDLDSSLRSQVQLEVRTTLNLSLIFNLKLTYLH